MSDDQDALPQTTCPEPSALPMTTKSRMVAMHNSHPIGQHKEVSGHHAGAVPHQQLSKGQPGEARS